MKYYTGEVVPVHQHVISLGSPLICYLQILEGLSFPLYYSLYAFKHHRKYRVYTCI